MFKKIFGTPHEDAIFFDGKQSYSDTCAIRCQEMILQQFSGQDVDEDELIKLAAEAGVYSGNGTLAEDVGALLEINGISVDRFEDASIYDLATTLAGGKKVIVGIDSGELWEKSIFGNCREDLEDTLGVSGADHAVIVCGVDTTDPDNVKVILADPGTGEHAATYDADVFIDAWKDSNFMMVATCEPAPKWLPEMQNFDYDEGHVSNIGGFDFKTIAECDDSAFSQYGFEIFKEEPGYEDFINRRMVQPQNENDMQEEEELTKNDRGGNGLLDYLEKDGANSIKGDDSELTSESDHALFSRNSSFSATNADSDGMDNNEIIDCDHEDLLDDIDSITDIDEISDIDFDLEIF